MVRGQSPPPVDLTPKCKPVGMACCEAVMVQLTKYCFAYSPKGRATRVNDATHWGGAKWVVPAAFDKLSEDYWPGECAKDMGPMAVTLVLSHIARFFPDDICAGAAPPPPRPAATTPPPRTARRPRH